MLGATAEMVGNSVLLPRQNSFSDYFFFFFVKYQLATLREKKIKSNVLAQYKLI